MYYIARGILFYNQPPAITMESRQQPNKNPRAQNHNEKKPNGEGIQDSRSQDSQKKAKLSFADKIRNALAGFFARAPSR